MTNNFILHEQLAKDTIHLLNWPLSQVLLVNDQQYPWLILVPRVPAICELYQLEFSQQQQLLQEINWASKALLQHCQPDKLNIAALGNVVPQLHIHVVARFRVDSAWPKPIWGAVAAKPYRPSQLDRIISQYQQRLANGNEMA